MLTIKYVLVSLFIICFLKDSLTDRYNLEDSKFWYSSNLKYLSRTLSSKNIEGQVKNIIFFVGDGMGLSTITAGRIYKGQRVYENYFGEEHKLSFEKFPNTGLSKTYNVDSQVTDSGASATALFSGVKTRNYMVGLDATSGTSQCDKSVFESSKVTTLATLAQKAGMNTGFVTTARVTHATPAALYAHSNHRTWECDTLLPDKYKDCLKDIARQLIEDKPGRNFKVIMGGGSSCLCLHSTNKLSNETCKRLDGMKLTNNWQKDNPDGVIVSTVEELMSLDVSRVSKILGLFWKSHLPYQLEKVKGVPSLVNMTKQAINFLQHQKTGFFLMVEGAKIDLAHHSNMARFSLNEVSDFDEAVKEALKMVDLNETLVVVTADHSHGITLSGDAKRGNDVLGLSDDNSRETLTYATGPSFLYHRVVSPGSIHKTWRNVQYDSNRKELYYQYFSGHYTNTAKHTAEDVTVYSTGPYSHLLRGTFEQTYIFYVMAYAACFEGFPSHCNKTI